MRIYRGSKTGYAAGALFTLLPITMMFAMLSPLLTGSFKITVNGVERTDPSAAIGPAIFLIAFACVGLAILAYQHFCRIEFEDDRIRIFNMWNRLTFDASLSGITRLACEKEKYSRYSGVWTLQADDLTKGKIPKLLEDYADLMRRIVLAIPDSAKPQNDHAPDTIDRSIVQLDTHKGGSGRDAYTLFFAVMWCSFGLVFLGGWTISMGSKFDSMGALFLPSVLLLLGSPFPVFVQAYRQVRYGSMSVGPDELTVDNGIEAKTLRWEDLIFAEYRTYSAGRGGINRELVLATRETSLTVNSASKLYSNCCEAVSVLAPPNSIVALANQAE